MPICSYIIYPAPGKTAILEKKLKDIPYTQITSDDDKNLFILLTETPSHTEEKKIQDHVASLEEVVCTTLSFVGNPDT